MEVMRLFQVQVILMNIQQLILFKVNYIFLSLTKSTK
jgi:hypothetical protein